MSHKFQFSIHSPTIHHNTTAFTYSTMAWGKPSDDSPARTRSHSQVNPPGMFFKDDSESFITPPGDLSEEMDETDVPLNWENFLDEISLRIPLPDSPYPSPPLFTDDNNTNNNNSVTAPPLQLLLLSRLPSVASTESVHSTSSLGDSYYNHSPPPPLCAMPVNPSTEATVKSVSQAKDCPLLTKGKMMPDAIFKWFWACQRYQKANKISNKVTIDHLGLCVEEPCLQEWFSAHGDKLMQGTVKEYINAFAKYTLHRNWAHHVREQVLSSCQGEKQFADWHTNVVNLNLTLEMSNTIKPLDNAALCAQLSANLDPDLRLALSNDPLDNIEDFDDWVNEVMECNERLHAEAERTRRHIAQFMAPTSSLGIGLKKMALSECLAPPPSLGSSSTPRQYLPKLTDTKKALLDTNQGCRRCCKPFVGHTSDACPMKANNTWPDVQSYIPITSATIEAAKLPPPGMVGLAATHKNLDQDLANYFAEEDDGVPMDNDTDDD